MIALLSLSLCCSKPHDSATWKGPVRVALAQCSNFMTVLVIVDPLSETEPATCVEGCAEASDKPTCTPSGILAISDFS